MKYNVSFVLDDYGYKRLDLYTKDTLQEVDEYLFNFDDSKMVREKYGEYISEYMLTNKTYIEAMEKQKNKKNNGRVCLVITQNDKVIDIISIIYKNSNPLPKPNKCLSIIKNKLNDIMTLKALYNRKRYLLSQYEKDLLKDYFLEPRRFSKYKDIVINYFIDKIKKRPPDKQYVALRCLMGMFELNKEIKTKYGTIRHISEEIPSGELKKVKINDDCTDEYFIKLINEGNYEELHNIYDAKFIDQNSDYYRKKM